MELISEKLLNKMLKAPYNTYGFLIHPDTWRKVYRGFQLNLRKTYTGLETDPKKVGTCNGYPLFRSKDMKKNKVKIITKWS